MSTQLRSLTFKTYILDFRANCETIRPLLYTASIYSTVLPYEYCILYCTYKSVFLIMNGRVGMGASVSLSWSERECISLRIIDFCLISGLQCLGLGQNHWPQVCQFANIMIVLICVIAQYCRLNSYHFNFQDQNPSAKRVCTVLYVYYWDSGFAHSKF